MESKVSVPVRELAKLFAKALPVEDSAYRGKVDEYAESVKRLPRSSRIALECAYIFSRKAPREEREDLFQELGLAVLETGMDSQRLAYTICRRDWQDWWRRYRTRQHFVAGSLNEVITTHDGTSAEFGELLVGEVDWEKRIDGKVDGEVLWAKLPEWVKRLVQKRLVGQGIRGGDRLLLNKWVSKNLNLLTG